ncbi:MAG TPA: DDE-type integrase/transposase/recombinase [Rhizomicrobium sp.]|nr:DDE-type integrase/transposase/recombinase [Rhizomicrobium sp.]
MSGRINFSKGDTVLIEEREHEFFNFVPSESGVGEQDDLQFMDKRDHRVRVMTRDEFDALYLEGKVRWKLTIDRKGNSIPEECCGDDDMRTLRQAFAKSFDEEPVSKTAVELTARYAEVRKSLGAKYLDRIYERSGGSLARWLKERGEPGNRPRKCMGDRRIRGPRESRRDPIVQRLLEEKAERYWDDPLVSAKDVYISVRTALKAINDERRVKSLEPFTIGRTSVWRYLTHHSDCDKTRRRYGARIADRMFKPLQGSLEAKRILDVAIMDHTWADCHVIDDVHNLPCGRPYITVLIDVRSRHILSYVIGFTPPSVETAMACLRRAVRPKRDLAERFPDVRGELPFGVPRTVLVDNGWEFSGGSFKDACEDAGITIQWAPVRTPEYKGICERFFRTLNQLLIHKLKGSVPMPVHQLREFGIDPSAAAIILSSELEELVLQAITEVYAREFHSGIKAVPEEVWKTRAEIDGIDYAADLRALDHSLAKLGPDRVLNNSGVEFLGLKFCSESVHGLLQAMAPRAPKRGTRRGTVRVKFKYWPENLSKISVWNTVSQRYVEVLCTDPTYANGLSEHHHKQIAEFAKAKGLEFSSEEERCAARTRLRDKIESFVTGRKIGDRRRAQRILADKQRVSAELPPRPANDAATPNVVPIETVANRKHGDQPPRNAVRKGKAKPAGKKQVTPKIASPHQDSSPTADPFELFNRGELLRRYKGAKQ